jgi:uncharacterized protein (TIGR02145 family)
MARNLNYAVSGSKCYGNDPDNCDIYGMLYDWATAMALPDCGYGGIPCSWQIGANHQGICPSGWHIPSNAEWTTLTNFVGSNAGTKLKATSGWNNYSSSSGNGTDAFEFAALPGGYDPSDLSGGSFIDVGNNGIWWSATEDDANRAYYRRIGYGSEIFISSNFKYYLFSVRCLQN